MKLIKLGPNHIYGQCIISDTYKICFILIPKNMSSTMRNFIKNNLNGYLYNYFLCTPEQKEYFTFCICRDIKKRFYSAINTILVRKKNDISEMNNLNMNLYVENMVDEHLVEQTKFIKDIKIDMLVNIEKISKYFTVMNESNKCIENKFNINDEVIMDIYKDDIEIYEQSKDMDLDKFLKILNIK